MRSRSGYHQERGERRHASVAEDGQRMIEALGQALREAGPVDGKTAQLIQLAAAAAIRSGMHGACTVPRGLYR